MATPDNLSLTSHTSPQPCAITGAVNKRWSSYKDEKTETNSNPEIPSTIRSSNSFLSYRQPYLGWRTQERLKLSSSYLSSPSQRLACTLLNQGQKQLHRLAQ